MRRSGAEPKFADGSLDVTYASAEAITVSELVPSAAAPGNVPRAVSATIAALANKPKRRAERSRPERTGTRVQSRLRRNMKLGHYRRLGSAWQRPLGGEAAEGVHEDGRRLQQLFEEVMLAHDDLVV
jgi:hypothetical protein